MCTSQWSCDSLLRTVNVHVEHFKLNLKADPPAIVNGEYVRLSTEGNVPYNVMAWYPQLWFPDQHLPIQNIQPDRDETYLVIARSYLGCVDSAQVTVTVDTHHCQRICTQCKASPTAIRVQ